MICYETLKPRNVNFTDIRSIIMDLRGNLKEKHGKGLKIGAVKGPGGGPVGDTKPQRKLYRDYLLLNGLNIECAPSYFREGVGWGVRMGPVL